MALSYLTSSFIVHIASRFWLPITDLKESIGNIDGCNRISLTGLPAVMSPHDSSTRNNRRKGIGKRTMKKGNKSSASAVAVEAERKEIESLKLRIENEAPPASTITLAPSVSMRFDSFPLSSRMLEGLKGECDNN